VATLTTGERAGAGQQDFSEIPRIAYPNFSFYNRQRQLITPGFKNYAALAAGQCWVLKPLITALNGESEKEETMLRASAQMIQGPYIGQLGYVFDSPLL